MYRYVAAACEDAALDGADAAAAAAGAFDGAGDNAAAAESAKSLNTATATTAGTSSTGSTSSSTTDDLDGPPRTDRPVPTPRYRAAGYPLTGTTGASSDETPGSLGSGGGGFGSGGFGLDDFVYTPRCSSVMRKYNRSWTPDFLQSSASSCVVDDVCSVDCLRNTRWGCTR